MQRLITDTEALKSLCDQLAHEPFVTLDTEFIREKTYWPQLCLVQIAGVELQAAIDPLAEGIDLAPLWELLANDNVLKVMHASRQDMEIFWKETGELPQAIFDTQIAAQVCGLGESVGYDNLVKNLLGKIIDKSQRFTDWAHRPLTQKQIDYAMGDVTYLRDAYLKMRETIESKGRLHWIEAETQELTHASLYHIEPSECWQRIRFRGNKPAQAARLKKLAEWRETVAQSEDITRNRIIRDDVLVELAINPPKDENAMAKVRSFPQHLKRAWRNDLWQVVQTNQQITKEDYPVLAKKKPLPSEAEGRLELLKLLLKICARQSETTPRLLADKDTLDWLARGNTDTQNPVMQGWRAEVFGNHALALMQGRLGFALNAKTGEVMLQALENNLSE